MRRPRRIAIAITTLLLSAPLSAAPTVSPEIAPLAFLVGRWAEGQGSAEGRTVHGGFSFEPVAGGQALLRRDRSEVFDIGGRAPQTVEQIMLIYPEAGHLRADYFDGAHAIHYTDAAIIPGRSVQFTTTGAKGSSAFRLTYELTSARRVTVRFEMQPPGQPSFSTVAEGTARLTR